MMDFASLQKSHDARMRLGRALVRDVYSKKLDENSLLEDFATLRAHPAWKSASAFEPGMVHDPNNFWAGLENAFSNNQALYVNKDILTSATSGAPAVRTDMESHLYALFLTQFPWFDALTKERANGLVHRYPIQKGFGAATFIGETDTVSTDHGSYGAVTTPIAIGATSRGATLVEQFQYAQSGSEIDGMTPIDMELRNAAWSMAKLFQDSLFQGVTLATHAGDEYGTSNANGLNGLRFILNNPSNAAAAYYPFTNMTNIQVDKGSQKTYQAINTVVQTILNRGGQPTDILMSAGAATTLAYEAPTQVLIANSAQGDLTIGYRAVTVMTVGGALPVSIVLGNSIGTYTAVGGTYDGTSVEDIYVVDRRFMTAPYLGSPSPMLIELQTGHDNNLTKRYIVAAMFGLAVKAAHWMGVVRIPAVNDV